MSIELLYGKRCCKGGFTYYNLLCVPSQYGEFPVALQPHQAILPSFVLSTIIGENSVPLWLPSQKGCFSDFPHAHQAYFFFSPVNTYGLYCGHLGFAIYISF